MKHEDIFSVFFILTAVRTVCKPKKRIIPFLYFISTLQMLLKLPPGLFVGHPKVAGMQ